MQPKVSPSAEQPSTARLEPDARSGARGLTAALTCAAVGLQKIMKFLRGGRCAWCLSDSLHRGFDQQTAASHIVAVSAGDPSSSTGASIAACQTSAAPANARTHARTHAGTSQQHATALELGLSAEEAGGEHVLQLRLSSLAKVL